MDAQPDNGQDEGSMDAPDSGSENKEQTVDVPMAACGDSTYKEGDVVPFKVVAVNSDDQSYTLVCEASKPVPKGSDQMASQMGQDMKGVGY